MKKNLIIILFLLITNVLVSQNLVRNGSFEEFVNLPSYKNEPVERFFAKYWTHIFKGTISSVDYFTIDSAARYPNGELFSERMMFNNPPNLPKTIDGNAFIGIAMLGDMNYLEFLTGTFTEPLKANQKYLFRMKIKNPNKIINLNKLEVKFSYDSSLFVFQEKIDDYSLFSIGENSNYKSLLLYNNIFPDLIFDSLNFLDVPNNWKTVEKEFTAKGGEKYFTVGLFTQNDEVSRKLIKLNKILSNRKTSSIDLLRSIYKAKLPFIFINKEFLKKDSVIDKLVCYFYLDAFEVIRMD